MMQEGRQSRASRVSADTQSALLAQQALLEQQAFALGIPGTSEHSMFSAGRQSRHSRDRVSADQAHTGCATVEGDSLLLQPQHFALAGESFRSASMAELEDPKPGSEYSNWSHSHQELGVNTLQQQPALSTVPESEQAEDSQHLEAEELDDLEVQQSQYEGISDSESDQLEGYYSTEHVAGSPQLEYEPERLSEQASLAETGDGDNELQATASDQFVSSAGGDQEDSAISSAAPRLASLASEASAPVITTGPSEEPEMGPEPGPSGQPEQQSASLSHSTSDTQQLDDPNSVDWGLGSSDAEAALRAEAVSLPSTGSSENHQPGEDEADFSVDTEVVMAYTDESVRHFLQAMELTETLDTFEREWEDRHNPEARQQRADTSLATELPQAGMFSNPLRESTASQGAPTPRSVQLAALQAELQATRQQLHETRALASMKELESQDAALQAQQEALEAIALAEQAAESARQQAAEAIHHARLAAAAAERNARELQAVQQQQREQQEAQRRQQQQQQQQQQALQPADVLQVEPEPLSEEVTSEPALTGSNDIAPPQAAPPPPSSIGKKGVATKQALYKGKQRPSVETRASDKIKPVASVRAAEAEEQKSPSKAKLTPLPTGFRTVEAAEAAPAHAQAWWLLRTVSAHAKAVAGVAVHPSKPIAVTASDDHTWRMWHLPSCEQIMTGEGHTGWVAGVDFHPQGSHLASASGDMSVKLWSFAKQRCVANLKGHTQAVWGVAWHDQGTFLASCSMDQSLRIWDSATGKCRQILRGHTDSVNDVCWQPFSGNVCSASADNSVCLWDARSGLPTIKLYGHESTCNGAAFNSQGSMVASCDASGVVRLWDVRKMMELQTVQMMPAGKAANSCKFDASGTVLAVSSDAGQVICYDTGTMEVLKELSGHTGAVQGAAFSPQSDSLLTVGSDCTLRMWGKHG